MAPPPLSPESLLWQQVALTHSLSLELGWSGRELCTSLSSTGRHSCAHRTDKVREAQRGDLPLWGHRNQRHQDLQPGPSSSRDQRSVWALTPHPMVSGTQAPCLQNEVVEVRLGSTSRSVLWFHMLVEKDWIQRLESPRKLVSLSYTHVHTRIKSETPRGPSGARQRLGENGCKIYIWWGTCIKNA